MHTLMNQTHKPFVADEAEAVVAKKAADRLRAAAKSKQGVQITVDGKEDNKVIIPLPPRATSLFVEILEAMANRVPMSLILHDAEVTTQQAADYLNVSRPYLIKQLETGKLTYRNVGSHRRIRFADLLEYERGCREEQKNALAALNEETKNLGLE